MTRPAALLALAATATTSLAQVTFGEFATTPGGVVLGGVFDGDGNQVVDGPTTGNLANTISPSQVFAQTDTGFVEGVGRASVVMIGSITQFRAGFYELQLDITLTAEYTGEAGFDGFIRAGLLDADFSFHIAEDTQIQTFINDPDGILQEIIPFTTGGNFDPDFAPAGTYFVDLANPITITADDEQPVLSSHASLRILVPAPAGCAMLAIAAVPASRRRR